MSRPGLTHEQVSATRAVLEEVGRILQGYAGLVLVGGTVPYLLIPQDREPHEGTVDIDIVVGALRGKSALPQTLHEILEDRLFQQVPKEPFRYTKNIQLGSKDLQVLVEFLGGGDARQGPLRWIESEDLHLSVIAGMDVALENPVTVELPGIGIDVSVASIPAFFAMKSAALEGRDQSKKQKDVYDIVYCLRTYPGGIDAVAAAYRSELESPLVLVGLERLKRLFLSIDAIGPIEYARGETDSITAALMRREAFERVAELLRKLGD